MCHYEMNWLMNFPAEFRLIVCKRYVDDCFAKFNNKQEAERFLKFLNKQHQNIFFYILIERAYNKFQTSVYQKKTHLPG